LLIEELMLTAHPKRQPYSPKALALGGLSLLGIGGYFLLLRPPLLPEDARYMGTTLPALQAAVPGLLRWLQKVFWVMGGYMVATGLLTLHVAFSSFRSRQPGAFPVVALAGLCSIGWMTAVNFLLDSDFKWLLLVLTLPWIAALLLYRIEK
jgi:hypothetical protein